MWASREVTMACREDERSDDRGFWCRDGRVDRFEYVGVTSRCDVKWLEKCPEIRWFGNIKLGWRKAAFTGLDTTTADNFTDEPGVMVIGEVQVSRKPKVEKDMGCVSFIKGDKGILEVTAKAGSGATFVTEVRPSTWDIATRVVSEAKEETSS
jgi:hypothetical protein